MFGNFFAHTKRKRKQGAPFYSLCAGMVHADVWRNQSQHGTYFRFSLKRRRGRLVNSYSPDDLLRLPELICDLAAFFEDQDVVPEEVRRQLTVLADQMNPPHRDALRSWQPYLKTVEGNGDG